MNLIGDQAYTQKQTLKRYFCECIAEYNESVVYLVIYAYDEAGASEKLHAKYTGIWVVLDVYTPLQMEYKKRHLRKGIVNSSMPGYRKDGYI